MISQGYEQVIALGQLAGRFVCGQVRPPRGINAKMESNEQN
jgi:hypothetical protein